MMYETKIDKVDCFHSRWVFSLGINLLILAIQPLNTLAQTPQAIAQSTNQEGTQVVNSNAARAALEPKILSEINRVRTNPQGYARWLEEQQQYFDGIWLKLPGEKPVRTNKGKKALEEAIAILKEQQPLPPLEISQQTAATATSELENFATASNIQYFSYGRTTATGIVMGLVVDDLFPDRRRRNSLLSPDAENTGVVCKPDPRYAKVCAIAYSDSATADVASTPPETRPAPAEEPTPIPQTETSTVEKPANTADAETTPQSEISEPEVITPPSEDVDSTATELPQPPLPQSLPTPTVTIPEPEPEPENTDLAKVEAEIEEVPIEEPEPEATEDLEQIEPEVVDENDSESDLAEEELEPAADSAEEVEEDEEIVIEDDSEVAVNSDITQPLEQIERGSLEEGDRIIADDGSLYDFYPIEGKGGESYTIHLESDEFDAFVALVDSNGNTIEENDDISQENSNSRIEVTLPEDGTYNVIVNTYDEEGTGQYVLTVTR